MSDTWLRFPYAKKPYADSTLRNMTKAQLIQVIRDYEHNYAVLYEANERGIAAAEKMIQDRKKGHWIVTGKRERENTMPDNDCTEREGALYVERDRAINEVSRFLGYLDEDMVERLTIALKRLPSIDAVERKTGKWLPTRDADKLRCSNCDVIHLIAQYPHGDINYCPNCGAKMERANV